MEEVFDSVVNPAVMFRAKSVTRSTAKGASSGALCVCVWPAAGVADQPFGDTAMLLLCEIVNVSPEEVFGRDFEQGIAGTV